MPTSKRKSRQQYMHLLMQVDQNKSIIKKSSRFWKCFYNAKCADSHLVWSTKSFRDTLKQKTDKDTFRSTEQFNRNNALVDTCFVSSIVRSVTSEYNEEMPKHGTQCSPA